MNKSTRWFMDRPQRLVMECRECVCGKKKKRLSLVGRFRGRLAASPPNHDDRLAQPIVLHGPSPNKNSPSTIRTASRLCRRKFGWCSGRQTKTVWETAIAAETSSTIPPIVGGPAIRGFLEKKDRLSKDSFRRTLRVLITVLVLVVAVDLKWRWSSLETSWPRAPAAIPRATGICPRCADYYYYDSDHRHCRCHHRCTTAFAAPRRGR
mmetsp:Transcript_28328/g.77770  ORF Transcript_28328/g.77770 Transcript_28328/m.77770 type:complete len:208 (-) Transcript_28328:774-1397(-)